MRGYPQRSGAIGLAVILAGLNGGAQSEEIAARAPGQELGSIFTIGRAVQVHRRLLEQAIEHAPGEGSVRAAPLQGEVDRLAGTVGVGHGRAHVRVALQGRGRASDDPRQVRSCVRALVRPCPGANVNAGIRITGASLRR